MKRLETRQAVDLATGARARGASEFIRVVAMAAGFCLLAAAVSAQQVTQTFDLRPGWNAIFLEVRPTNAAAQALYSSAGFVEIGRRKAYYRARIGREDAVVLALDLAPGD